MLSWKDLDELQWVLIDEWLEYVFEKQHPLGVEVEVNPIQISVREQFGVTFFR